MFSSICSHVPDSFYWEAGPSSTPQAVTPRLPTSASSSSLSTITSSLDVRSNSEWSAYDPAVRRTPLSGKAKPFISSKVGVLHPLCEGSIAAPPNSVQGSEQEQVEGNMQTDGVSPESMGYSPLYAVRAARAAWFQAYAQSQLQEEQEEATITEETTFNEDLQEKVGAQQDGEVPHNKHSNHEGPKDKVSSSDINSPTEAEALSRNAKEKINAKSNPCPCLPISAMLFPVKHTFIHYTDTDEAEEIWETAPAFSNKKSSRSRSAPKVLTPNDFDGLSFSKAMASAHLLGSCNPCAYYHNKADGCHWGIECKFCHLCPGDEIKKRKKLKIKALKEKLEEEKREKLEENPEHVPNGQSSTTLGASLSEHDLGDPSEHGGTAVRTGVALSGHSQSGNVGEKSTTVANAASEAETPSDTIGAEDGDARYIQELSGLSLRQLRLRAAAAGADHDSIEDARDSETAKIALMELVIRWESLSGGNEQSGSDLLQRINLKKYPTTGVGSSGASCDNPQSETQTQSETETQSETQARREAQRLKQIFIGKAQPEYQRYVKEVPPDQRDIAMPTTPDYKAPMSKRQFDRALSEWRRQLHEYNEPKVEEEQSYIASWFPF